MDQFHRLAKLTSLQKIQKNLDLVLLCFLTVEYISNGHSRSARSVDLFANPPIYYDLSICSLGPTDRRANWKSFKQLFFERDTNLFVDGSDYILYPGGPVTGSIFQQRQLNWA